MSRMVGALARFGALGSALGLAGVMVGELVRWLWSGGQHG